MTSTKDIQSILVPIDFSPNSATAVDYARTMADRFGASIHLLHVCEVPSVATASMDAYAITYSDWSQRFGQEAEAELLEVAAGLPGLKVSTEVLFGHPAKCIVSAAERHGVDMIVMGTHGHGPVMHVLMGNVAERVVRTAPCPVLTVREPRAKVKAKAPRKARTATMVFASVLLLGALLSPPATIHVDAQTPEPQASANPPQRTAGRDVFRNYCATCHGPTGRGDGPLADSMRRKPANLTEIAKRNGGTYPSDLVFRTIDGRQPVRGHGGPDMPVWGDAFARSTVGGNAEAVRQKIESLVKFLETIQVKPAN